MTIAELEWQDVPGRGLTLFAASRSPGACCRRKAQGHQQPWAFRYAVRRE